MANGREWPAVRGVRLGKALGHSLTGETYIGLGQFADHSCSLGDGADVYVEYELTQHHPAANVLKYWPHLEGRLGERMLLLHIFSPQARKLRGARSELVDWVAAKMVTALKGRFAYLRVLDEPDGLSAARNAIERWQIDSRQLTPSSKADGGDSK